MHDEATVPASVDGCPSEAELRSLAWGGTAVAVSLSSHISSCGRCAAIVANSCAPPVTDVDDNPGDETRPSSAALGAATLAPDTLVGRYQIVKRLGHGGMGIVYHAIDTELDRAVALKLVRATGAGRLDELTERLRRESRLQARAAHPNVITVHDIGRAGDQVYVAMELANGGTLGAWLARPRGWRQIVDVFCRAGAGLAAAHDAGLVHRDFKPDNVLVEEVDGRVARVLVTDFGVARVVEAVEQGAGESPVAVDMTAAGALVGTPAYMAPEQLAASAVDARTDVFAFGVGLWEALYGGRPFTGSSIAELVIAMAMPLASPSSPRGVPGWLERVLRRALEIAPADRFGSMTELLRALDWRMHRRRNRVAIAAGAGVAIAATVVAGVMVRRSEPPPSPCDVYEPSTLVLQDAERRLRTGDLGFASRNRERWITDLESYRAVAAGLRDDVCHAAPQTQNWRDRLLCLDRATAFVGARVERLMDSPVSRRAELFSNVAPTPPYECATDVASSVVMEYPADGQRAAVVDLSIEMDETMLRYRTRPADALHGIEGLAERAKLIGSLYFEHELALQHELVRGGGMASSDETLRRIAFAAEHDGQFRVASEAWLQLNAEHIKTESDRGRDLIAQADESLKRAGDPPRERARWYLLKGFVAAFASDAAATAKWVDLAESSVAKFHVPSDTALAAEFGDVEARIGNSKRALVFHQRAYDATVAMGQIDEDAQGIIESYAATLIANGRSDRARVILEARLASVDPSRPVSNLQASAVSVLATAYNQLGLSSETIRLYDRFKAPITRDLGAGSFQLARVELEYAAAELAGGHAADAERGSRDGLETYVGKFGPASYDSADARVLHGQALLQMGRVDTARDEIERGANDLAAAAGEADPLTVQARIALATTMLRQGQPSAALATIVRAFALLNKLDVDEGTLATGELVLAQAFAASHRELPRARTLVHHALGVFDTAPDQFVSEIRDAKALISHLH